MTKQKFMVSPPDNPEYIGSPDTTFSGSRNGLSPIVLWEYFANPLRRLFSVIRLPKRAAALCSSFHYVGRRQIPNRQFMPRPFTAGRIQLPVI
ncbi:hypothetical protein QWZ04_11120 [Vibrio tapetis subsp. quintayensis]|nr:hypothetical protein [Vibrio tapetis]MDN3680871.1 hypothetical protein [Vibrio tapetis subsp. quintayensis]